MDDEGVVKVGDFGLARDVYAHLYYRGDKHSEIPVKWSAPEMLTDSISTEMSDVVSLTIAIKTNSYTFPFIGSNCSMSNPACMYCTHTHTHE